MPDGVPRQGADEVVPGIGVAGPWTRLVREKGVLVAWLVSLAGCHAGSEDRQVHAVKVVEELAKESPVHPLCQSRGKRPAFRRHDGHWSAVPGGELSPPRR